MVNFHGKPFDDGTIVKLELFKKYAQEWLPVFISPTNRRKTLTIVDFFAGPGNDAENRPGSPLILLQQILKYASAIEKYQVRVHLVLNEAARRKAQQLRTVMEAQSIPRNICSWEISNLNFDQSFQSIYPRLKSGPNLLFLDQQGIKFISDKIFKDISQLRKTDFIFFIASSFLRRFSEHPYFKKHISIPGGSISARSFSDTHRAVTDYYRSLVVPSHQLFLTPFSIKKGSNIYGVIFGSQHPKGIEKFLRICWAIDPDRGEANFDIDADDIDSQTPHLFPEMDETKKVQVFQSNLRKKIVRAEVEADSDVYLECLREGMLPKHGREILRKLMRDRLVRVTTGEQPRVSLAGYNAPRQLEVITRGTV